jgi:predicted AAA+ superfamily ATPase
VSDTGARNENFIASHLLKAIHWWQDNGFGEYGLYYVRTKDKREVDFLVTKDNQPWFLIEVKSSPKKGISKNLQYFQSLIGAQHAFQISIEADFVDADCFEIPYPVRVPARTFLSQLI